MRVNKNLLLQKTNKELEDYLKPNKGYVTDAIEYAVEILTSRGYEFSEEQKTYIEIALRPREKLEGQKNYVLASNIIFASLVLGLIHFFVGVSTVNNFSVFGGIFSLIVTFIFGLMARTETSWLKYLLIVLSAIGLLTIPFTVFISPIMALINFGQLILHVVAIVFLFKAPEPKQKVIDVFDTN
ncbi:MAG: hypothetical protein REI64_17295 [Pedobacter sp.]|uniref:hypothetical protein n=1 Tax=Pedobacter sp. TaxID=1411316 RepID=UPI002807E206|nr:hypothetical protein [Pedobacter sp.]MDQ8006562.1 hypothetical protein [Pedobacter sp.]